jgi:hypothetical protein
MINRCSFLVFLPKKFRNYGKSSYMLSLTIQFCLTDLRLERTIC